MSATSARRPKDRNGVVASSGAKPLKPSRSVTPIPVSFGKENSSSARGPVSKAQIRPKTRPKTRPEAAAGAQRWSASSAPRGRSPSPSELARERRVSAERSASSAGKPGSASRVRVSDFGKERKGSGGKSGESGSDIGIRVSRVSREESSRIEAVSDKISKISLNGDTIRGSGRKVRESFEKLTAKFSNGVDLGVKEVTEKTVVKEVKVLEVSGAKESKYQSKLHEKLAFLEGKVKRIASDIKKTKEILDQNNPDASKVILLDIQDKITGIEKAMGKVGGGSDSKIASSVKGIGVGDGRDESSGNTGKSSVKGLNSEELEARLFPHHKLLRNRATHLKAVSTSSNVGDDENDGDDDGKASIAVDENPIEAEFLASLNKEQPKVTIRERNVGSESVKVEQTDGLEKEYGDSCPEVTIVRDDGVELVLTTDETLDEFDDEENRHEMNFEEEIEDNCIEQLNEIGLKTSTGGWFVGEGESVLLAHDDGSCSFHDVVNSEEKAIYKPPSGFSPNMWRDCWLIRAPSADGCAGRYVVAASAGNAMDSGFCSWDFYTKDIRAFHAENGMPPPSRMVLGPLPNNVSHARSSLSNNLIDPETRQWWYRPSGPLIAAAASCQRAVSVYDVRDGERIMKWDVPKPVVSMDFSSPLQWRNRGKVVVAETESISLWDVNSLSPQALLSVPFSRKISALHVNNTDAELGGGVRQRLSSSEAEGNDGVFSTHDSINILDFRHPTGVGIKISKHGSNAHSVFSRGDSVFLGCTNSKPGLKRQFSSEVQHFSLRKQRLFATYALPDCNADLHHAAITQVWGNSSRVMGVCGLGLFVFDASRDNEIQLFTTDHGKTESLREIMGPEDMYLPSFDFSGYRALLISRDRPAMWRHLS